MSPVASRAFPDGEPVYRTAYGAAFLGDSRRLLADIPTGSADLVFSHHPTHSISRRSTGMPTSATTYSGSFRSPPRSCAFLKTMEVLS